jgi:hypothetical protein
MCLLAFVVAVPDRFNVIPVTKRDVAGVHVRVFRGIEVRASFEHKTKIIRLRILLVEPKLPLIARNAVVCQPQVVAIEVIHGDHLVLGSREVCFHDCAAIGGDAAGDLAGLVTVLRRDGTVPLSREGR